MRYLRTCAGILAVLLLAGCAGAGGHHTGAGGHHSSTGRVGGRLVMEGGPISTSGQQPGERPIPGTVTFTAAGHQPVSVRAGNSGTFTAQLPPGLYNVSGRSPRILTVSNGTTRALPCSQPLTVTVTAGHTTSIAVTCIVP